MNLLTDVPTSGVCDWAQRSIGSQVVDNLNATTHVRTLLTDLFLLDETIKISGL